MTIAEDATVNAAEPKVTGHAMEMYTYVIHMLVTSMFQFIHLCTFGPTGGVRSCYMYGTTHLTSNQLMEPRASSQFEPSHLIQ